MNLRARFALILFICAISATIRAETAPQNAAPSVPPKSSGLNVLILGDSLSLCGFGKRLDERFRQDSRVRSVFTYMTCGTTPLSWLKEKPYASIQARCGFWSIESLESGRVREVEDVYGMRKHYSPQAHLVPKIEEMLPSLQPDILIMQTGTNLFDLFGGRKVVRGDRDAAALRNFLAPFMTKAIKAPSSLKKIYWVASPTSGRVSMEVQDFVFNQTHTDLGAAATVIDSRNLVAYPYRHMEPDKEHFIGPEMDQWADGVYAIIDHDMAATPIASLKPLSETVKNFALALPPAKIAKKKAQPLVVKAKLLFKSAEIPVEQLLPYQELLVAYVYEIRKVASGAYEAPQILVMHPAYIGLKRQKLERWKIGKTYRLRLREMEGTPWESAKSKDDSGLIDLQPYMRIEDEARYPGNAH